MRGEAPRRAAALFSRCAGTSRPPSGARSPALSGAYGRQSSRPGGLPARVLVARGGRGPVTLTRTPGGRSRKLRLGVCRCWAARSRWRPGRRGSRRTSRVRPLLAEPDARALQRAEHRAHGPHAPRREAAVDRDLRAAAQRRPLLAALGERHDCGEVAHQLERVGRLDRLEQPDAPGAERRVWDPELQRRLPVRGAPALRSASGQ